MKKSRLLVVVCACLASLTINPVYAVGVSGQGTWESTLSARDLDGNMSTIEAYYDTVLDITWLADANAAGTDMNWTAANSWAAALSLNGISGWRLPYISAVDGAVYDFSVSYDGSTDVSYNVSAPGTIYAGSTGSELAHLFHNTLGNLGFCDPALATATTCAGPQTGWGLNNTGPFLNLGPELYWSGTEESPSNRLGFDFNNGRQQVIAEGAFNVYAWAVHDGDVGAAIVPVPAALYLFGSGLLGLIGGIARRKKTA